MKYFLKFVFYCNSSITTVNIKFDEHVQRLWRWSSKVWNVCGLYIYLPKTEPLTFQPPKTVGCLCFRFLRHMVNCQHTLVHSRCGEQAGELSFNLMKLSPRYQLTKHRCPLTRSSRYMEGRRG